MFEQKELSQQETKDALSLIQDPFLLQNVQSINIHGMPSVKGERWNAIIDFRNGNTTGSQETGPCRTFQEVVQKLRAVLDEVQRK